MDVGLGELELLPTTIITTTTMVEVAKVAVTETEITTITTTIIVKWTTMVGLSKKI